LTVVVQLSDLHLCSGAHGVAPAERLEHVLRGVSALQPRAEALLLSGDLADVPSAAAYAQAHEMLARLGLPIHAIPGNHDDRDMLRARFGPDSERAAGAAVNFAVNCGPLRVVGCDSTVPGAEAGALGPEQLDWLEQTLALDTESPTLLALHHPPVLTGVRSIDAIALAEKDRVALEELVARHPQVQTVACGHAHVAMTTTFASRALLVCPSTDFALRLDLLQDDLPFAFAQQPLGFAVHALVDGRLVSHVQSAEQI
jgi:3',5'-cyclic-AMP phosphodiesterase